MPFWVHKIAETKWRQNRVFEGEDFSADAITSMRTRNNTLSMWEIANPSQLDDATLAIISAGDKLDSIDVVMLDPIDIIHAGLLVEKTEGRTALQGFTAKHYDIEELTYTSLGTVAQIIVNAIGNDRTERYTIAHLKRLLRAAIDAGRIRPNDLNEGIKSKL